MADPPPPVGTSPPPSNKGRDNEEKAAGQLPAGAVAAHDVSAESAESVEVTSSHSPPARAKRRRGGEGSKGTRSSLRKRSSETRPRSASTSPSKVAARTPPQNRPADRPSQPDENRQNRCATVSPIPSRAGDPPCPNDEKTNPGGWNPYVFRPKFKGKHGEYQYHALSSGATPVPYNEETKISSKSADGMYNTEASEVRWSIVAAGARTTCVLMAEEASCT